MESSGQETTGRIGWVVGYADDPMIIVRGPFRVTRIEIIQIILRIMEIWSAKTNLLVNPKM